jgi:hypothetical protein
VLIGISKWREAALGLAQAIALLAVNLQESISVQMG